MDSTAPRVEILTIGVQMVVCLLYLCHPELISNWMALEPSAEKASFLLAPSAFIFVGLSYSLGAVIDGFTAIFDGWLPYYRGYDNRDETKLWVRASPDTSRLQLDRREVYEDILKFDFDLRLLRSTGFNLAVAAAISVRFGVSWISFAMIGGAAIVFSAWWRRRNRRARRTLRVLVSLGLMNDQYQPLHPERKTFQL